MSQTILGLDVGHRRIKAVVLDTTFKSFQAVAYKDVTLPETTELPWTQKVAQAVRRLIDELGVIPDVTVTALPGDKVTTRLITVPFTKRREIDLILGPELEEHLPFANLGGVVFDYQILGHSEGGSRLLAAVADRTFLGEFLEALKEGGVDPRIVTVTGFSKADLFRQMAVVEDGPLLCCDIGHQMTTVTVVRESQTVLWRAFMRGGGRVEQDLAAVDKGDPQAVSDAISRTLGPLVRDLRQTMLTTASVTGEDVKAIYLCGGASRLGGLDRYFASQLKVDTVTLEPSRCAFNQVPGAEKLDSVIAEPLALALRALPGPKDEVNLRQGPFAFSGDFQYLRGKVLGMAAGLMMLLLALGVFAYSQYYAIRAEEVALLADLQAKTQIILGKPYTDFEKAARAVTRKDQNEKNPIPRFDAYHLLYEVSVKIGDDVLLDLDTFEVDLDRHRAELRGRTDSASAVRTIIERLGKVSCFGRIETERNERGTDDKQIFNLSVRLDC